MADTMKPLFGWRAAVCASDLSPTARLVALTLSLHMNELGGSAFPGPARLAQESGLHVATVKRELVALERAGWLRCVARGGGKGEARRANEYEATIPATIPVPVAHDYPYHTTTGSTGLPVAEDRGTRSTGLPVPVAHGYPSTTYNSTERTSGSDLTAGTSHERAKPRRRIPDDWEPSDADLAWVAKHYPQLDAWQIAREFRTYWQATGKTMADWSKAYRNRVQKVASRSSRPGPARTYL